jgi:hypothetical protein
LPPTQARAHPAVRNAVLSLIIASRGFEVFGSGVQILGAGNAEDLPDDVSDFPEHWT